MSKLHLSRYPERLECRLLLTGTPRLVADLADDPVADLSGSFVADDLMYFYASEKETGRELWQSDGTEAGTQIVADFAPGPQDSDMQFLGQVDGSRLFLFERQASDQLFAVPDGQSEAILLTDRVLRYIGGNDRLHFFLKNERELWRTDGTVEGTFVVLETNVAEAEYSAENGGVLVRTWDLELGLLSLWHINNAGKAEVLFDRYIPRPIGDNVTETIVPAINGWLFGAEVRNETSTDAGLWFTEGSAENTAKIDDRLPDPIRLYGVAQGQIAFSGQFSREILLTDGTTEGTLNFRRLRVRFAGQNSSGLFATVPNEESHELQRISGPSDQWEVVASFDATNTSFVENLSNDRFLFRTVRSGDATLWISDGTEAGTIPLPVPIEFNQSIQIVQDEASDHFGIVVQLNGNKKSWWLTDGTAENTRQVHSSINDSAARAPSSETRVIVFNESMFFVDRLGNREEALWEARPNSRNLHPIQISREFSDIHVVDDALRYLVDTESGVELQQLTFDSDGNRKLERIQTLESSTRDVEISQLTTVGDQVYFVQESELWVTRGTPESTIQILPTNDQSFAAPIQLLAQKDWLYFLARDSETASIWRTDGTSEGTEFLQDYSFVADMFAINETIYLITLSRTGVWQVIDLEGNSISTNVQRRPVRLNENELIHPLLSKILGADLQEIRKISFVTNGISDAVNFGNRIAFNSAGDVWTTDGTEAGTFMLSERKADAFLPVGDQVVFRSDDKFYISDGTQLGTAEIPIQLPVEGETETFHYLNETLFVFRSNFPESSYRLFAFRDGETQELLTLPERTYNEITAKDELYFASDGLLWQTDGTKVGTRSVPGVFPVEPRFGFVPEIVFASDHLFFLGDDGLHGEEIWSVPLNEEPISGDADRDGELGFSDFLLLAANFGELVFPTEDGDLDGNGRVDFSDFLLLAAEWKP